MVKTYLRYRPSAIYGIISTPGCNIVTDASGKLVFTGQLENVGVWNIRRGVQVCISILLSLLVPLTFLSFLSKILYILLGNHRTV